MRELELGDEVARRTRDRGRGAVELEKRPEPFTNARRQDALEILERRAAQDSIVGAERPQADAQRLGGKRETEQREYVVERRGRPLLEHAIDELVRLGALEAVEESIAAPDASIDTHLALYGVEDLLVARG